MKNKKFYLDSILNIFATCLPIGVLQVFIFPRLVEVLGGERNGMMLAMYSSWILFAGSLGSALCGSKIINSERYRKNNLKDDFILIVSRWMLFVFASSIIISFYYNRDVSIINLILELLTAVSMYLEMYLESTFKTKINFIGITINKILITVGYIIGYLLFIATGYWEFVFLLGYGLSCLYCLWNVKNDQFTFKKTEAYAKSVADCRSLAASLFVSNLNGYADKLVIYPLMGGDATSLFYIATVTGKIITLVSSSMRDVILSYISKWGDDKKGFLRKLLIVMFLAFPLLYFVSLFASRIIISFLYKAWFEKVLVFLPLTTASTLLDAYCTIIHPFTLRYCKSSWQIFINFVSAAVYFIFSLILWPRYGLIGFCIGGVLCQLIKMILMLSIYHLENRNTSLNA